VKEFQNQPTIATVKNNCQVICLTRPAYTGDWQVQIHLRGMHITQASLVHSTGRGVL